MYLDVYPVEKLFSNKTQPFVGAAEVDAPMSTLREEVGEVRYVHVSHSRHSVNEPLFPQGAPLPPTFLSRTPCEPY